FVRFWFPPCSDLHFAPFLQALLRYPNPHAVLAGRWLWPWHGRFHINLGHPVFAGFLNASRPCQYRAERPDRSKLDRRWPARFLGWRSSGCPKVFPGGRAQAMSASLEPERGGAANDLTRVPRGQGGWG